MICPKETYNLLPNPTFFLGLDGWESSNALLSRTNVNSFDSGFGALIRGSGDFVTAERREYIESEITGYSTGFLYTFSMYLWQPQIFDTQDDLMATLSIVDSTDNGVTFEEVFSQRLESVQKWDRLSVSKVIRADATNVWVRVNLRSQDQRELGPPFDLTGDFNLNTEFIYADMGQFEIGGEVTTPFHGDYKTCATEYRNCEPFRWLGTPHNSVSYRSDCTRDSGELVSFSSLGFEILEHTGHGAPPVRDIFYDYANRPGGEYQKTAVDTNVLTFTGYLCEKTLAGLECGIFGIKDKIMPNPTDCRGLLLLVYIHDDCKNVDCDPERYMSYCVSYIGGMEGLRNNLYQQDITLQFRAHKPFPVEWPGHSAQALSYNDVVIEKSLVKLSLDGVRGYPIEARDYRTVTCLGGSDNFIIAGQFEGVNDTDESVNVAVHNCDEICPQELLGPNISDPDIFGGVNVSVRDAEGNAILGGAFITPFVHLAIYFPDTDSWGGFNHTAGEVFSLVIPYWADLVAGTDDAIHFLINGEETIFPTNGRVNALAVTNDGTLYAFGAFTEINGVEFNGAARYNPNEDGCLNFLGANWEGLGYSFNGDILTATALNDTVYIGGAFTEATPDEVRLCEVVNQDSQDSKGANQIFTFLDDTPLPGQVQLRIDMTNPLALTHMLDCIDNNPEDNPFTRITAKSTLGTTYTFVFTTESMVGRVAGTTPPNVFIQLDFNKDYELTGPCADNILNDEIQESIAKVEQYAGIPFAAGVGIDDSINSITYQCGYLDEAFQGDTISVNHIAAISGDNVTGLGDGIPVDVTVIFANPDTGEILAGSGPGSGFTDGLGVWNGQEWLSFCSDFGGIGEDNTIIDIDYCDCDLYVLFEGMGYSLVPGYTGLEYLGGVETHDFDLVIHGPASLNCFQSGQKQMNFCTDIQCGEVATLNFDDGSFLSNVRDLGASILGGSRYDIALDKCDNDFKLLLTNTDATTKATVIYRRQFWGIEGMCCANRTTVQSSVVSCCPVVNAELRPPTSEDCPAEGHKAGDVWLDLSSNCTSFFLNTGQECCPPDFGAFGFTDGVDILLGDDGEPLEDCEEV